MNVRELRAALAHVDDEQEVMIDDSVVGLSSIRDAYESSNADIFVIWTK